MHKTIGLAVASFLLSSVSSIDDEPVKGPHTLVIMTYITNTSPGGGTSATTTIIGRYDDFATCNTAGKTAEGHGNLGDGAGKSPAYCQVNQVCVPTKP
jgi:hypothetical protein